MCTTAQADGYGRLVGTVGRRRWERLLLMAALVLGVLAMHAVPAVHSAEPSQDSMSMSPLLGAAVMLAAHQG